MMSNAQSLFNFDLGETADAIRETVRDFAANEIAPRAEAIDKTNTFPRDLWPKLGALGLHGITVEEDYGGAGLGYLEHCIAMEEISALRPRSACPTARTPTSASIRSAATATKRRSRSICRS